MKKNRLLKTLVFASMIVFTTITLSGCEPQAKHEKDSEQTIKVQDTGIYKILTALGFDVSTVKVVDEIGKYKPKTGEIILLSYREVDHGSVDNITFIIDRENSTNNNILYKVVGINELFYFSGKNGIETYYNSKISISETDKSIDIYLSPSDIHQKYALNDEGTLAYTFIYKDEPPSSSNGLLIIDPEIIMDDKLWHSRSLFITNNRDKDWDEWNDYYNCIIQYYTDILEIHTPIKSKSIYAPNLGECVTDIKFILAE